MGCTASCAALVHLPPAKGSVNMMCRCLWGLKSSRLHLVKPTLARPREMKLLPCNLILSGLFSVHPTHPLHATTSMMRVPPLVATTSWMRGRC